jgi:hypothetical protein
MDNFRVRVFMESSSWGYEKVVGLDLKVIGRPSKSIASADGFPEGSGF